MNDLVRIPQNKYQLMLALGKEVLRDQYSGADGIEEKLAAASIKTRLETALEWCEEHREEIIQLVELCKRARRNTTPYCIIVTAVVNNVNGIRDLLTNLRPSYLAALFKAGVTAGAPAGFLNLILCLDPRLESN